MEEYTCRVHKLTPFVYSKFQAKVPGWKNSLRGWPCSFCSEGLSLWPLELLYVGWSCVPLVGPPMPNRPIICQRVGTRLKATSSSSMLVVEQRPTTFPCESFTVMGTSTEHATQSLLARRRVAQNWAGTCKSCMLVKIKWSHQISTMHVLLLAEWGTS